MSANTLYDVLQPIIFLINLYGVKIRAEKRMRKVIKGLRIVLCLNSPICLIMFFGSMHLKDDDSLLTYRYRIKVVACTLCFVYLNWKIQRVNVLMTTLKKIKKSTQNEKAFRNVKRVLLFAFGILSFENLYQCILSLNMPRSSFLIIVAAVFGPLLTYFIAILACVIISFFVCLVVYYVSLSLDGPIEELERCTSPLRKSKMTSDLIRHFYQANKLTREINAFNGPLMFILKTTAILQFFTMAYFWENKGRNYFGDSVSFYPTFIYLWFLRIAPSANSKLSQLYRTLRKSVMEDDLWLSRDPTSRPHLLRLRLSQLEQLTHLSLDQSQFTVLNEPVDETDIFLFFVEMNDTWNTVHTAKS